jgi:hypothetical protein
VTDTPPQVKGTQARSLVLAILLFTALFAVLPVIVARTRRLQGMRSALAEVLSECRARYAGTLTAADTVSADAWRPPLHGAERPGDPSCGAYRRRNMLRATVK